MRVIHSVTHCRDCPMADWEYSNCNHPLLTPPRDFSESIGADAPPEWCPLRAGELLLKLRTK